MDALVLSGGNLKGSWQAGAIAELLGAGVQPEIVTGISVGALNAAALAAWQADPGDEDGWAETGADLAAFWESQVTGPDALIRKRGWLELGWRFVTKDWAGLVDTTPLGDLVRETLGHAFPRQGGIACRVGAVNLRTGALEYTGPDSPSFLDAVLASTAEPIGMPARKVGGDWYVDGGVREITPLAEAIRLGADRIWCVVCQPQRLGQWNGNAGALLPLIGRQLGIVSHEILENDLRRCAEITGDLLAGGVAPSLEGKRPIEVIVVRPLKGVALDITRFDGGDIARAVEQGRTDARRVLGETGLAAAA